MIAFGGEIFGVLRKNKMDIYREKIMVQEDDKTDNKDMIDIRENWFNCEDRKWKMERR